MSMQMQLGLDVLLHVSLFPKTEVMPSWCSRLVENSLSCQHCHGMHLVHQAGVSTHTHIHIYIEEDSTGNRMCKSTMVHL